MADFNQLNEEAVEHIKKTYSIVKALDEDRKSVSEDIRDAKIKCSKQTGMTVKDINGIVKILRSRENGSYSEDYVKIAKAVEGIAVIPNK